MRDEPTSNRLNLPTPDLDPSPYEEPPFNFRHGLKVLIVVGVIVTIISVICIGIDGRYG